MRLVRFRHGFVCATVLLCLGTIARADPPPPDGNIILAQSQLPPSRLSEKCAQSLNPLEAFNDPNGFEKFFRNCYLDTGLPTDLWVATVAWISSTPNPFQGNGGVGGYLVGQAGVLSPLALKPDWIPKVYLGLIATANPPPPMQMVALQTFRQGKQYRALLAARIHLLRAPGTGEVMGAQVSQPIIDGGWTPPFNRNIFVGSYLGGLLGAISGDPGMQALNDSGTYAGEASVASKVLAGPHPNTVLHIPAGERIVADALIRFRAGAHTDEVGVQVGSPNHVPWVWNEFAVTANGSQVKIYGAASAFPTTWWYVDGTRIKCVPRLADSSIPSQNYQITTSALKAYPALSTGASTRNGAAQVSDNQPSGPIGQQPYTVGAAGQQWSWTLGTQVPAAPAVAACGG
jgi:hypothetical protein